MYGGSGMNLFAQKTSEQSAQVEHLFAAAAEATAEVKKGNEQLVQADERSASFRKYILVILFTASFILLFLDWYE